MTYLSVVIPCFNEEVNIQKGVLFKVRDYLDKQKYDWEVIVVDDGSCDESVVQIKKFISSEKRFSLIINEHQGKAHAVISGVQKSKGEVILFTDMDQAAPIEEIEKLLPYLSKNYDVIIGSRNENRIGAPAIRLLMARGFMLLRRLILGMSGITDTQCGFKLFSRKSASAIFERLKLYSRENKVSGPMVTAGFDVEILFLAQKLKFKIKEIPIYWRYVETRRVNPITESINGFLDMIKLKINDIRGLYK
jgi:glycosyltransferase involved in cell wall biosynthesis